MKDAYHDIHPVVILVLNLVPIVDGRFKVRFSIMGILLRLAWSFFISRIAAVMISTLMRRTFDANKSTRKVGEGTSTPLHQSIIRSKSVQIYIGDNPAHNASSCVRCRCYYEGGGTEQHHMDAINQGVFSDMGVALVASFAVDDIRSWRSRAYGLCLFASENLDPKIKTVSDLYTVVANLLQRGMVHHTTQHPFWSSKSIFLLDQV